MFSIDAQQLKKQLAISFSLWVLAIVAIIWLDKPLALLSHKHGLNQFLFMRVVTEWIATIITILVTGLILFYYWGKWCWRSLGMIFYFYLTLLLTITIKIGLKIMFGRYWPNTWNHHNLSLIHDGIFGFNWWHGFANQSSFPSGHLTYVAFCCVWLIILARSFRYVWYFILVLLTASLVILNYHFLGDCLAGIGLGYGCGYLSLYYLSCRRDNNVLLGS